MTAIALVLGLLGSTGIGAQGLDDALPQKPIVAIALNDVTGKKVVSPDPKAKFTVAIFVIPECPIANRYAPEIKRICDAYESKGVAFRLVYSDPDVSPKQAQEHMKDYGLQCVGIVDARLAIARAVGATVSPEAAVIDPKGKVLYRGQIDDLYVGHGNRRPTPKRKDLRIALDEALAGKAITKPVSPATGCFLRVK